MEYVILVDEKDGEIGTMEKMAAHSSGSLHRAISIFVFNQQRELLIHRRASGKYHSAGLWTNTCCSHPRPGEKSEDAAKRRLREEMGFTCDLRFSFSILYNARLENGLIEHEFDHVFTGSWDGIPDPDPAEVSDWKFVSMSFIREEIEKHPETYTAWFRLILPKISEAMLS